MGAGRAEGRPAPGVLLAPRVDLVREVEDEIDAWCKEHAGELDGPYQSESFGGYSYTRVMGADGRPLTWRDQFKARMDPWRKL